MFLFKVITIFDKNILQCFQYNLFYNFFLFKSKFCSSSKNKKAITKFTISMKLKYIFNHKLKHFKYTNFKLKI